MQISNIMKETRLGDFEETLLLIIGILGEQAYALKVSEEFTEQTGRDISVGAVHSTLNRLEKKGFLNSAMGDPTPERGGRRKRIYRITASGYAALESSRAMKLSLWRQFPGFASDHLSMGI